MLNWGVFFLNFFPHIELLLPLISVFLTGNSVPVINGWKWEFWGQHATKEAQTPSGPLQKAQSCLVQFGLLKHFSSTCMLKGILVTISGKHWDENYPGKSFWALCKQSFPLSYHQKMLCKRVFAPAVSPITILNSALDFVFLFLKAVLLNGYRECSLWKGKGTAVQH